MNNSIFAAKPVEDLLDLFIKSLGLNLSYRILPPPTSAHLSTAPTPELRYELSGPDAPLLTANNGELLHAVEHIAAKILNLEPEEHDRLSLDAEGFKQNRDLALQRAADAAIARVIETGRPYVFPPMTSRERRMLHLALQDSGLPTASSGEAPRRFVVLYPEATKSLPTPARTDSIRSAFRPR